MAFEHQKQYETDIEHYSGPMDRVSPYHFYQFTYWLLRRRWRRLLYAWTRRAPCDAKASIEPSQALAGIPTTVTLAVVIGKTPLKTGGRIAVYCQKDFGGVANQYVGRLFQGPDGETAYGARITSSSSRDDVTLRVRVHSTGSVFTCAEVFVESGKLVADDIVTIVFGDPSCKPPVVCEKAKSLPFRVAIDYDGKDVFMPIAGRLEVTVVGNRAAYMRCFAPATPVMNEPFDIRVVAADLENHNPAYNHNGRLRLSATEDKLGGVTEADLPRTAHGTVRVEGVTLTDPGVTRIRVTDEKNGLMGETNPICPEFAPKGLHAYFGDIHSHTELSDGTGSCEDNFRWARDVEGLDFAGLADHFEDGQSYNYTLEDKWNMTKEATRLFYEPGRFVTLLGYEIASLESHRNVYFRDDTGRMIVQEAGGEQVSMDNVYDKLEGTDYILIPHAPKFSGINWNCPHRPDRQRLIEICSAWGISEEGGPRSVRHALDMGYQFGFIGGTDNHSAEPGNPLIGGITGVYAATLTREAIFDALIARHTFATNGPRMSIRFECGDLFMGDAGVLPGRAHAQLSARVLACDAIQRLEIVRNGKVVHIMTPPDTDDASLEWEDKQPLSALVKRRKLSKETTVYYYLRVVTVNGAIGWSSPVWIAQDNA